jgi:hypothetical protein
VAASALSCKLIAWHPIARAASTQEALTCGGAGRRACHER